MSMNLTVLIVEDEPDMAQYLKDVLEDNAFITYIAHKGAQALQMIHNLQPELVLLDVNLPDIDGWSVCKKILSEYPKIKVIMVTADDTPGNIAHGLQLGAQDYLTKPIDSVELLARIKARLKDTLHQTAVLSLADLTLNQETHEVTRGKTNIDLSPQEFKLLQLMLLNQGKVLTRAVILSRLWETNPDIETRVVDVYVGYLRKKIDTIEPKLIHSIRGFGYMMKLTQKNLS